LKIKSPLVESSGLFEKQTDFFGSRYKKWLAETEIFPILLWSYKSIQGFYDNL